MTEEFIYYLWQYRLYDPNSYLVDGTSFDVVHVGYKNSDSGPDFFNAKIKIGDTLWAGNVEVHVNSSDWFLHRHDRDPQYDNTILHVVWEHNADVRRKDKTIIPTLELKNYVSEKSWQRYLEFMTSNTQIPCQNLIGTVGDFELKMWLQRLLVERLQRKSLLVELYLTQTNNDWAVTFYKLLAYNMGFKVNQQAFEMLAQSLPYNYLLKHSDDLFQIEAMILGQAGLLRPDFKDKYPQDLYKEYKFLQHKFSLKPIDAGLWKFMRLHPENFPTLRLTQLAALIHQAKGSISELAEISNIKDYYKFFDVKSSSYWDNHYVFDKISTNKVKRLGKSSVNLLIINLLAPFLFVYYKRKNISQKLNFPISLLEELKAENNSLIRKFKAMGIDVKTAADSQALIQLNNFYCNKKQCLNCGIGISLLKN
ncbi:MAG: DUF2851 family protein [Bacteroidales bacterium]|jgi:hypothetical protein